MRHRIVSLCWTASLAVAVAATSFMVSTPAEAVRKCRSETKTTYKKVCTRTQQIVAKLDRLIENVAKSSGLLRLVPTQAPIGPSAVIRPVPGGEHKGMLKLVDFTQPANGTVSRNADQTLTFRPKPGFTGKDSFDYTLRDEAGTMFSATVTVAVTLEATGHSDPTTPPHLVEPDTA